MKVKYTEEQLAALETLKEAVRVFNAAICAFDAAQPNATYGGGGWAEHNLEIIYDLESEIEVEDEDDEDDE